MNVRMIPAAVCLLAAAGMSGGVEVSGNVKKPHATYGRKANYKLVGDTTFGWVRQPFTGDVDINAHKFVMETGGGNRTVFSGVISGKGQFFWNGGGQARWQVVASFLAGTKPNTFSGTLTILRGTLALAKPPGVDAVAGDLVLGGGSNQAIVRLDAPNQIKDSARILITGKHEGRIRTQGFDETVSSLSLQAHGYIDLGDGASALRFADSSAAKWDLTKTLTVRNWTAGKDKVVFGGGRGGKGLSEAQLSRVGFAGPSDRAPGLYTAKMLDDGQIAPDRKVRAVRPPFDVSQKARAEREKIYDVPGRANLSGPETPLTDGMRISLFGDSITWQNVYITTIGESLKAGAGTKGMEIRLFNHGINGGGVLSIRDGTKKSAYVSASNRSGPQSPFARVIAADKANVAVVYIGVNDVWWRKTRGEDFEQALRDIAASAKANKTTLVLATLSVLREMPDGTNPADKRCDQFAEITRKVAAATGATLVDLRKVFIAYLRNHNAELRVDGTLKFLPTGVLTYDGVHANARGNALLGDHIAQGIHEALKK